MNEGDGRCTDRKCAHCDNCEIVRITGRMPKKGRKCSYFKPKKREKGVKDG